MANNIARQVEGKIAYRRAIKMAIANTMRMGAEGIKIQISGRLNGAEMARSEMYKEGRTPLHTFRADIDYCHAEALTKVGLLGIKVWICRGEVYGKRISAQLYRLKRVVVVMATITVVRTSKRKQSLTDLNFRNYVTNEKDKIQKTTEGQSKGNAQRGNQLAFGSFGIKSLRLNGLQVDKLKLHVLR